MEMNFVIWENAGIMTIAQRQVNAQIQWGGSGESVDGSIEKQFSHCPLLVWWKFFSLDERLPVLMERAVGGERRFVLSSQLG